MLQEARSSWLFDIKLLQSATHGHALSCLALDLFQEMGLVKTLGLHSDKLANFLEHMECRCLYNPYHNSMHTALVLQVRRV